MQRQGIEDSDGESGDDDFVEDSDDFDEDSEESVESGRPNANRVSSTLQGNNFKQTQGPRYDRRQDDDLSGLALGEEDFYDRITNLLTGKTTGRRIKRAIFKYGSLHSILGFALVVLSSYEVTYFQFMSYFNATTHGASILVSILSQICILQYQIHQLYDRHICTKLFRSFFLESFVPFPLFQVHISIIIPYLIYYQFLYYLLSISYYFL